MPRRRSRCATASAGAGSAPGAADRDAAPDRGAAAGAEAGVGDAGGTVAMKFSVNMEATDDELKKYASDVLLRVLGALWGDVRGILDDPQATAVVVMDPFLKEGALRVPRGDPLPLSLGRLLAVVLRRLP